MKASVEAVFKSALQQYAQGLLASSQKNNSIAAQTSLKSHENAIYGLCIAYSGGLDSTVLLHIADAFCKQTKIALTAVHVNHGISANAKKWQAHCQTQCAKINVPFYTESLALKKMPQQSLEADARDARYSILDKFAGLNNIVLLAQHQNDQAETLLIQLKRGAGIKGLAAMPMLIKRASGVQYLRPLLNVDRAEILRYAKHHKLDWIDDESNEDDSYDRNFLRNQVLPILTNRWPSFIKTVARSARHCAQENEVNTEYMNLIRGSLIDNNCINLCELTKYSLATQECFVRYWLFTEYALTPSSAQLKDIIRMTKVLSQESKQMAKNPSPHIRLANYVIERYQDKLMVMPLAKQITLISDSKLHASPIRIEWDKQLVFKLNESYSLQRVDRICANNPNVFSLPEKGVEYVFGCSNLGFKYKANRPTKTLKAWYQEWGISPMQRQQIPVFIYGERAIVIGLDPIKESNIEVEQEIYVELCRSKPI